MYFLELESGAHINLFGLQWWQGGEYSLTLHYPGMEQVILEGEDARRALVCLSGFTVHIAGFEKSRGFNE